MSYEVLFYHPVSFFHSKIFNVLNKRWKKKYRYILYSIIQYIYKLFALPI